MFSHLKSEVKLNMKTTGIVRRIDELGRVVIPKEIRKTMRLKEGEELEVFVNDEETLVLKKYSTIKSFKELAKEYVEVLYKHTGYNCLITDTDEVIAAAIDKSAYEGKRITKTFENFLRSRKSAYLRGQDAFKITLESEYKDMVVSPLVVGGDCIGSIALISEKGIFGGENVLKLLEVGASFFVNRIE